MGGKPDLTDHNRIDEVGISLYINEICVQNIEILIIIKKRSLNLKIFLCVFCKIYNLINFYFQSPHSSSILYSPIPRPVQPRAETPQYNSGRPPLGTQPDPGRVTPLNKPPTPQWLTNKTRRLAKPNCIKKAWKSYLTPNQTKEQRSNFYFWNKSFILIHYFQFEKSKQMTMFLFLI